MYPVFRARRKEIWAIAFAFLATSMTSSAGETGQGQFVLPAGLVALPAASSPAQPQAVAMPPPPSAQGQFASPPAPAPMQLQSMPPPSAPVFALPPAPALPAQGQFASPSAPAPIQFQGMAPPPMPAQQSFAPPPAPMPAQGQFAPPSQLGQFSKEAERQRIAEENRLRAAAAAERQRVADHFRSEYNARMNEGKGRYNGGEPAKAMEAFRSALLVQGYSEDKEAMQWLAASQQAVANRKRFTAEMDEANRHFRNGNFPETIEACQRALDIQGFTSNEDAISLLNRAQQEHGEVMVQVQQAQAVAAQYQAQYAAALEEGQRLMKEAQGKFFVEYQLKYYRDAEQVFLNALMIPGFEGEPTGRQLLHTVRGEIHRMERQQNQANRNSNQIISKLFNFR